MGENSLYLEWNLVATFSGVTIALLSVLWWIHQIKIPELKKSILRIKAALSHVFQSTIDREILRVIELIDEQLPVELSQSGKDKIENSIFDKFCVKISQNPWNSETDSSAQENRNFLELVLVEHLSGIITKQAQKIVYDKDSKINRFEFETEVALKELAVKTAEVERKERSYFFYSRLCKICVLACALLLIPIIVGVLFNKAFLYYVCITSIILWVLSLAFSIISFVSQLSSLGWFQNRSERCDSEGE